MKKLMLSLALATVGMVSIASAQCPYVPGEPTRENCTIVNGQKVYVDPVTGQTFTSIPTGTGNFTTTTGSTNPCAQSFTPTGLNTVSNDPLLGTITTTLDPSRNATPSTVRALQASSAFPAQEDLYFPILVTVSSRPGVTLRSVGEIHLKGIINVWPQRKQSLRLAEPVVLEDVRKPGQPVLVLRDLSVVFN